MISWADETFSISLTGEPFPPPVVSWQGIAAAFSITTGGPETLFNVLAGQGFFEGTVKADPSGVGFENDVGTVSFTPVSPISTPEPSTFALMLLGIGLVLVLLAKRLLPCKAA
jgi:hypothetical protein